MAPVKTESFGLGSTSTVPQVKTENLGVGQLSAPQTSSSATSRSIFDIDSPVKSSSNSWISLFGDDLAVPASNPTQPGLVEVKQEKDSFASRSAAAPVKSHSDVFAPKTSKMSSLFSPQSDSESKPIIRSSSQPPPPHASNSGGSDLKPIIKEELPLLAVGSADFGRSAVAAIEPKVEPQLLCSIPNVDDFDKSHKKEKKHKEKKKKKNKDKDKDRESEEKGDDGSGSSSKRHKNKHKEKSKHRDEERPVVEDVVAPKPALKLKISLPPPTSAPQPQPTTHSIAPLKIRLGSDMTDAGSKKRPRDSLENGPAPKRVSVDHGGSNSSLNNHHHQHKSSKKVSS